MHRGNDAQQSILTEHSLSPQTRPNLKKSKWSTQLLMPAILPVCRSNLKASTGCGGNREGSLQVLCPWATKYFLREELQVLFQAHLLATVHRNLRTFNSELRSFTSYHQGLFRWKWSRACTGWAQAILALFSKEGYVRRRLVARRVPKQQDHTLLRELRWHYLTLHCCFTKTIRNSLGFSQSTGACLLLLWG